jgi:hypothetical protein
MQPQVFSGARTILKINDEAFAAGFVVDYSIDTEAQIIQGIDSVFPDEIAPQTINVTMNIRVYRTPNNDPVALGIAPKSEKIGVQEDFLKSPYIQVELRDKLTEKTIFYLQRGWLVRRSGSMESIGLLTENWTIRGIGFIGPDGQTGAVSAVSKAFGGPNLPF